MSTLGSSWKQGREERFDEAMARESLRWFNARSVPHPDASNPDVSEVRFVADLRTTDALPSTFLDECGEFVQAMARDS
jgi:hypothetical protein